ALDDAEEHHTPTQRRRHLLGVAHGDGGNLRAVKRHQDIRAHAGFPFAGRGGPWHATPRTRPPLGGKATLVARSVRALGPHETIAQPALRLDVVEPARSLQFAP